MLAGPLLPRKLPTAFAAAGRLPNSTFVGSWFWQCQQPRFMLLLVVELTEIRLDEEGSGTEEDKMDSR